MLSWTLHKCPTYLSGNFPFCGNGMTALCPKVWFFSGYIKYSNNRQYWSGVLSFYSQKSVLKTFFSSDIPSSLAQEQVYALKLVFDTGSHCSISNLPASHTHSITKSLCVQSGRPLTGVASAKPAVLVLPRSPKSIWHRCRFWGLWLS